MNLWLAIVSKLPVTLLLVISASATVAGDYFAKYWSTNQKTIFFVVTLLFYFAAAWFYIPTLLREGLVVSAWIWTLLNSAGFTLIGILVFGETLALHQWLGVGLGFIALSLLSF